MLLKYRDKNYEDFAAQYKIVFYVIRTIWGISQIFCQILKYFSNRITQWILVTYNTNSSIDSNMPSLVLFDYSNLLCFRL